MVIMITKINNANYINFNYYINQIIFIIENLKFVIIYNNRTLKSFFFLMVPC